MKLRAFSVLLVLFSLLPLSAQPRSGRGGEEFRWAPDGKHIIVGSQWHDPRSWEEVEPVASGEAVKTPRVTEAMMRDALREATQKDVSGRLLRGRPALSTLPRAPESPGMVISDDGTTAVALVEGTLWVYRLEGGVTKLAEGLKDVRHLEISPKGSAVSYIKDFDLYAVNARESKVFRLSSDGGENLFYGELDWVYQEEVYGRFNFKGSWWSPNDQHVAFLRIDEEGVNTFTIVDHIPDTLNIEQLKYPKAGTTNPRATLHIARGSDGKVVAVDLSKYKPEDEILIVRVGWTPDGNEAFFKVQNREQTWLDLNFVDPNTGKIRTAIHEECADAWVNVLEMPDWLKDGTFLWRSERTGFLHLYHYDRSGKLLNAVTSGEWQVRDILRLDEERGQVTFYGTKDGALGQNAYRVGLDGEGLVRLTKGPGTHSISLNGAGDLLIDSYSSIALPPEAWLRGADGTDLRALKEASSDEGEPVTVLHQIKARDGETLDLTVTKPQDFDPSKSYPVWIQTYSGPDSPTVRDRWSGRRGAPADMIMLQVNVRTASGRGMKYTKQCYRQLGVQELKDLEDAVKWLTKEPWADAKRVGITGSSYGGFMAAYALTHSDLFKVGIAVSGVYDWRLYDTIYTERYMAKPQNNAKGYDVTSVVKGAKNLNGQLLIVHGTMDDNVHAQNAIQLSQALQRANQQFELMLYPKARHGVGGAHFGSLRQRFIRQHLLNGAGGE